MSCGGTVIETIIIGERVWINTREKPTYRDTTAIYVENTREARAVMIGDLLWWQGGVAYWTPKDGERHVGPIEVKLKRRGCSGVSRPTAIYVPCQHFEASDYENTMCERCHCLEKDHIQE